MDGKQWNWDATRQDYYYWDSIQKCCYYERYGRVDPEPVQEVSTSVEGGPPDLITEPRALQVGIRAHKRVRGRSGDYERLDPRFTKHTPGRDFYKVGKVFKVLWPEPAGNPQAGVTFVTGAYGELIYNKIRWFVVIREGRDFCTCLSIQTYNGQGVAKPGVEKAEHSVMYTGNRPPRISQWEDPAGEMLQPIPIVASNPAAYKMDVMSRLNYAKPYTVEHNVKSLDFGAVAPGWIPTLSQNFLSVLQRGQSAVPSPPPNGVASANHHLYPGFSSHGSYFPGSSQPYSPHNQDTRVGAERSMAEEVGYSGAYDQ